MPQTKIIHIFEFERPVSQSRFFPFDSATWGFNPSGIYEGVLYDITQPQLINDVVFQNLFGVKIITSTGTEILSQADDYVECVATAGTWYFNGSTLFIHFPNSVTPYSYASTDIILLQAYAGYYKSTADKELSLFGGFYEPRLSTFPMYRAQLDNYATGKQAMAGGSVVLDNTDGALDNFSFGRNDDTRLEVLPKIGWYGRIRQAIVDINATPTDSDFLIISQGFTSKITENVQLGNGRGVEITLKDIRASLDKDIPLTQLSATTYNKMSAKDIENPPLIPLIYGKVSRYKVFCLNETESATYYKYLLGNANDYDYTSIDKIYVQDKEFTPTEAPTILYADQSDGTRVAYFQILRSNFVKVTAVSPLAVDYVGYTEVSADLKGIDDSGLMQNGLDVVKDLILLTYQEPYTADYFNLTAWASVRAIAPNIGIVIDKPTQLKSVIEEVQKTIPLSQFQINDNQKYSWVDYSWSDAGIVFEILPDAFPVGYIPSPDVDAEQIAAKLQVNFDRRYTLQSWARVNDITNQSTALDKFNTDRTYPEEYNTIASDSTGAISIITRLKEHFIYPNTTLSIQIPMQYKSMDLYAYELKAGDKIKILANTEFKQLYGYLGCIIHEIKQDINAMKLDLVLKVMYISNFTYKQPVVIQSPYDSKYLGDGAFVFGGIR